MRDHTRAIEAAQEASEHDTERKHTREIAEIEQKCQMALYSQRGTETQEETLERAMRDPEVAVRPFDSILTSTYSCAELQSIMNDPVMQQILQQAQENPKALQDHMKNPVVKHKIQKLINAGIIRTR